jgi:hypothetical protein
MTAQQPQLEYIITEEQLAKLILDLEYQRYNLARITQEAIRSRPHTPAPEQGILKTIMRIKKYITRNRYKMPHRRIDELIDYLDEISKEVKNGK